MAVLNHPHTSNPVLIGNVRALARANLSLYWLCLLNFVDLIGLNVFVGRSGLSDPLQIAFAFGAFGVIIGALCLSAILAIGQSSNWNNGQTLAAFLVMALNTAICYGMMGLVLGFGLIGFSWLHTLAINRLKAHGVACGWWGPKWGAVAGRIAHLAAGGTP